MPVVSEFAGNSLLCHLIGRNAFSARVKKLFRFSDWPMCVTKRVFHMGKIYSKNSVSI